MSSGFVDELIRLVVKYEGAELRRGKVDVDEFTRSVKGADTAAKTLGGTNGKGGNLGMSMLMLSQFMDDAQYGMRGIMNNIPGMAMAFGAGPGLAGGISLAVLAVDQLMKRMGGANQAIANQAGLINRDLRPAWQRGFDEISRGFLNYIGNLNGLAENPIFGEIRPGDMGPGGQNAVEAQQKRVEEMAKAAIDRIMGVGAEQGDAGIGKIVREQIAKAGGGEKILTALADALIPKNADPAAQGKMRDNLAKLLSGSLDGMNVDQLVQQLRTGNQGALADKILQAILPAQRATAEAKAREALLPLMEGVGAALRNMNATAPRVDAAKEASGFQGRMAGAGVYPEVQRALAEYMNGPGGRAKVASIPLILNAFGNAGFSQREAYEGLLLVFQLMDRGTKLVPAIQQVINRVTKGGMAAELNALRQTRGDRRAEQGFAMLGIEVDQDPNKQSRVFLRRSKDADPAAALAAAGRPAGAANPFARQAPGAANPFEGQANRPFPDRKDWERAENARREADARAMFGAQQEMRTTDMLLGGGGTDDEKTRRILGALGPVVKNQKEMAAQQAQYIEALKQLEQEAMNNARAIQANGQSLQRHGRQ